MAARNPRAQKPPPPISPQSLERAALFHLERRALTVAQLKKALQRKVKTAAAFHGEVTDAPAWIDEVIARCVRSGYLDDARVASGKARSLRARGKSARAIAQTLRHKGVEGAVAAEALTRVDDDSEGDPELNAARAYVQRRKLLDKDPQKALAALARQGFSFAVAKRALVPSVED